MQLSAREIAAFLGGTVEGDPDVQVNRPSKIEEGGAGSISFLGNPKYEEYAYKTTASVLLVKKDFKPRSPISATLIRVEDVYTAISQLLEQFGNTGGRKSGISDKASVSSSAKLGQEVAVGDFTTIGDNSTIGDHCTVHGQVYIGKEVSIGPNTILYPGVRILDRCKIGANCILHANVVIGSDGFGFAPQEDGSYKKVVHVGNVILEDKVEIGAQSTIDRATMGSTIIREGVKMDNLIQVGHNVEIGAHTVIAAQTGIAGSTKIGKHCRIGGQVGFVGHIEVADGTQIQAQSGIASHVKEPNQALFGSPAFAYREFVRSHAIFKKLPELYKQLNALERAFKRSSPTEDPNA
jgi:UDP-3-O-[3-hydroxymyristoyl] glucosamine N-acyltransferase